MHVHKYADTCHYMSTNIDVYSLYSLVIDEHGFVQVAMVPSRHWRVVSLCLQLVLTTLRGQCDEASWRCAPFKYHEGFTTFWGKRVMRVRVRVRVMSCDEGDEM